MVLVKHVAPRSGSHVERVNLHVRMMSRRFTRLTTGFSKKRDNLKAAVALFAASYNLCWVHSSIRDNSGYGGGACPGSRR